MSEDEQTFSVDVLYAENFPETRLQMTDPGKPVFPHRLNRDGSFDSICASVLHP